MERANAMNEFPSLDDFSVTEYGDIHLVDPRVVNVLQVAGKAHIEYCYENDDMMCSIDSNPDDGKWRWMIIQRHPYLYMDDGNFGGTKDLMSAYEEAKAAYLSHRQTMESLKQRLGRQDDGFGGTLNPDVVVQMPSTDANEDVSMPVSDPYSSPQAYEGTSGTHYATSPMPSQPPYGYDGGHVDSYDEPLARGTSIYDPLQDMAPSPASNQFASDASQDYVEQTPLAAFDEFDDMLDKFFSRKSYETQFDYDVPLQSSENANVDFGTDTDGDQFIFDMDIDEFLGLDQIGEYGSGSRKSTVDDAFSKLIETGLNAGSSRFGQGIRGDPE